MVPEVKEYGCQRSGTNFLRVVLQENYEVKLLTNVGGWKHGYYDVGKQLLREVDVVICVKDPYAWVLSQYNFLHPQKDVTFDTFVTSPLQIGRHRYGIVKAANPIAMWSAMYEHWLGVDLLHRKKFVLRHEDSIEDPIGSIREIVAHLHLRRREPLKFRIQRAFGLVGPERPFFLPTVRLMGLPNSYSGKDINRGVAFDASHYKQRKYLAVLTPTLLDFVNGHLDQKVLDTFGYKRVVVDELVSRAS